MDIAELKRQTDILNDAVQKIMDEQKNTGGYTTEAPLPNALEWGPDEGEMTWDDAVAFVKAKGDGWRLPTVAELVSQFDYEKGAPKHSSWKPKWYWSSSPDDYGYARGVYFGYGVVEYNYRDFEISVRCVR